MARLQFRPITLLCLLSSAYTIGVVTADITPSSSVPSITNSLTATRSLASASSALDLKRGGSVTVVTRKNDSTTAGDDETEEERAVESSDVKGQQQDAAQHSASTAQSSSAAEAAQGQYQYTSGIKVVHRPLRITSSNRKAIIRMQRRELKKQKQLARLQRRLERRRHKQEDKSYREISKKLKNRNHLNLSRKFWHAGVGLSMATANHLIPRQIFLGCMTVLSSGTLVMELLRYRKGFGWMNDALHFCLGGSLRKHEMEGKFTGSFYYFLGVTLTAWAFPGSSATLGICQLALADPSASFFGRQTKDIYWSRIENGLFGIGRNKGVLGFLGGALVCLPFNYRVLSLASYGSSALFPTKQTIFLASIALGLAGAFADLCVPTPALSMPKKMCDLGMPPFHVDDNIVVPIFSGYACTKIYQALGWTKGVTLAKGLLF